MQTNTREAGSAEAAELARRLSRAGVRHVESSELYRSLYSADASIYRVRPQAVFFPHDAGEVLAALEVCRELGVPLTARGAGTSIAGNAVGPGLVMDSSRHFNRLLELDPEAGTAVVEPGLVQVDLQRAALPHGLRFGPDPSTHNRATLGGMIGNNACGNRAMGYGRTSDNVLSLDVVTGTGERLRAGTGQQASPLLDGLERLIAGNLGTVRTEFGRFGRQVSGYSLEHLLPENKFNLAGTLVGSEGTLAVTLGATVRLVRDAPVRLLVVLGYPSMADAADAVPTVLPFRPIACEGLDSRITDVVARKFGSSALPPLPRGGGWLMVELAGDSLNALTAEAARLAADTAPLDFLVLTDPAAMARLWRIREDGAGLSARTAAGHPAHAGWEDSAVPPENLGRYLRELDALLDGYGLTGLPYGHFGDGCLHIRLDFPFERPGGTGVFHDFLLDAGRLAARHGGSMSGEHGDGRARSELLPLMYSPAALELFGAVKELFDPQDLLNPGVIVRPAPATADLIPAAARPVTRRSLPLGFGYHDDDGDLSKAVHRCTGVGRCRVTTGNAGVMCPSFQATRDEKDSTRGRARVLQDVVTGNLGPDGWRSEALHDALDLCLSCKGCASDCPTGVDMALYKSEALHQKYRGRLRPLGHYAMGWLPRWLSLASSGPAARLANAVLGSRLLHPLLTAAAGIDRRRPLPVPAIRTLRAWFEGRAAPKPAPDAPEAVLFVDTFTNAFSPEVGRAAVAVLEDAGYRVSITGRDVCCGITWITTGQLDEARRRLARSARELAAHAARGAVVVGLEPSCTAVLRGDALHLLEDNDLANARAASAATRTLAEALREAPAWQPPDLAGYAAVAQPHCHHHAVLGWEPDRQLLADAGAEVTRVPGCCGIAGNFGMEKGHHDVSVAVAEVNLLPALAAAPDADVLADGFGCRTQLDHLTDRQGRHLAQLLADAKGLDAGA
ncbi:FAD-binding oxidoreductase [Paenarthrobacter sp. DKR-5]|uniref:FAD-binding and (Fe-S)-binding domain-containing protein n=1 Tax=Paenarthrobacter sp. DKR-5 TaxID=2835535 RepID=UPI001BDCFA1C|nr:FAD-binding and (Fe-S)-binding domain-containing protein [Paenarthrobacter sp. DKR-5]MBT1001522.1 FAD-binding oxidoreductase [Paenarthrobacter sp. DKR-5]